MPSKNGYNPMKKLLPILTSLFLSLNLFGASPSAQQVTNTINALVPALSTAAAQGVVSTNFSTVFVDQSGNDSNTGLKSVQPVKTPVQGLSILTNASLAQMKVGIGFFTITNVMFDLLPYGSSLYGSGVGTWNISSFPTNWSSVIPTNATIFGTVDVFPLNMGLMFGDNSHAEGFTWIQEKSGHYPIDLIAGSLSSSDGDTNVANNATLTATNIDIGPLNGYAAFAHLVIFGATNTMQIRLHDCNLATPKPGDVVVFGNLLATTTNSWFICERNNLFSGQASSFAGSFPTLLLCTENNAWLRIINNGFYSFNGSTTNGAVPTAIYIQSTNSVYYLANNIFKMNGTPAIELGGASNTLHILDTTLSSSQITNIGVGNVVVFDNGSDMSNLKVTANRFGGDTNTFPTVYTNYAGAGTTPTTFVITNGAVIDNGAFTNTSNPSSELFAVEVIYGATPAANSPLFGIKFGTNFLNPPLVFMSLGNSVLESPITAAMTQEHVDYTSITATNFNVNSGGTAPATGTTNTYMFFVGGK